VSEFCSRNGRAKREPRDHTTVIRKEREEPADRTVIIKHHHNDY